MDIKKILAGSQICLLLAFVSMNANGFPADTVKSKNIYLVLDNSGSMKTSDPDSMMKKVVENLIRSLDQNTKLGIIVFDSRVSVVVPLTDISKDDGRQRCLDGLKSINYRGDYTNIPAAIERAIYDLKNLGDHNGYKSIVFITDGKVDTGDKEIDSQKKTWLKESLLPEANLAGIKFFGIAFTDNADFELINELSIKTSGEYYRAFSPDEFEGIFARILARIKAPPAVADSSPGTDEKIVVSDPKIITPLLLGILVLSLLVIAGILLLRRSKKARAEGSGITIPPAQLIDLDKASKLTSHVIKKEVMSIGRDKENDIWLSNADDTVTRYNHAKICFENNKFYIQDLSRNYTKKNDIQLEKEKKYELANGDIITFVKYNFRFSFLSGSGKTTVLAGLTENEKKNDNAQPGQSGPVVQPASSPVHAGNNPQSDTVEPEIQSPEMEEENPDPLPADETPLVKKISPEVEPDPEKDKTEPLGPDEPEEYPDKKVPVPESTPKHDKVASTFVKSNWCPNCPGKKAEIICVNCQKAFCEDCIITINEVPYCKACCPLT